MKVTIPSEQKDITLNQWQQWQKVIEKENQNEEVLEIFLVSIFCKLDTNDVLKMRQKDLKEIAANILMVITAEPKEELRFKIGDQEFGMIPNFDNMSAAEYIDLDKYIGDPEQAHRAMSVLYRPVTQRIGKSYKIEEYKGSEEYSEQMKQSPLSAYLYSQLFFYNLSNELLKATKAYFQNPKHKELEEALAKNGGGTQQFIQLLEKACLILERQLQRQYTNFYTS